MEAVAQGEEISTMLVGDFNAVIDHYKAERWDHAKGSAVLRVLVTRHRLVDTGSLLSAASLRQ